MRTTEPSESTWALASLSIDRERGERVLAEVYDELHSIARRELDRGGRGSSLDSRDVLHEAYLKLRAEGRLPELERRELLTLGAVVIRHVLVDLWRRRTALKRGGDRARCELSGGVALVDGPDLDLMALHEALTRLAQRRPRWVRVVELRFFAGLSFPEVAEALGTSLGAIKNDWRMARAWLQAELGSDSSS